MSETRIKIAIQKSGRLTEHSTTLLQKCGLIFSQAKNQLIGYGENMPIDLMFVRDDDIPDYISLHPFKEQNLFFGGVNAVTLNEGFSDIRRGGVYEII